MTPSDDQQPIQRTVGRRRPRVAGPPDPAARAALAAMARYQTRAPKGVFIYRIAAEMEADRLRWTVDAMVAKQG